MTANEAKKKLIDGNDRFVSGSRADTDLSAARRQDLSANGQHPFATIICCSDSRVAPELLFDQGLGDLFVIRTAGNVVDDIALGSIEYAAEHLGVPLIVVLGHTQCGAVKATVDGGGHAHGCIKAIVDKIAVSMEKTRGAADAYTACEDENIAAVTAEIAGNTIVSEMIAKGETTVVGAKYNVASGAVTFM